MEYLQVEEYYIKGLFDMDHDANANYADHANYANYADQDASSRDQQIKDSIPIKDTLICFTGDLTPLEKANVNAHFVDNDTLSITFQKHSKINVTIRRQDIFASKAQVIVNAANTHLGGGGGIDGAIHREGGAAYAEAHRALQKLYKAHYIEGHAAMIQSGALKKKYHIENVIVVAGPSGETSASKETALYSCYLNALLLADEQGKTSLAFPSISTGLFGFPKDRAAMISLKAIHDFLDSHPDTQLNTISIHFLSSDPISNLEIYRDQIGGGGR